MADVFLSYHSDDRARARAVAQALEAEGVSVWWDPAVRAGEPYDEAIERQLREARVVVGLWSPRAVASRWVRAECTIGDRRNALAPALIEPCDRPVAFELLQTADLTRWAGDRGDPRWRTFAADIIAKLAGAPAAPVAGAETQDVESLFWASIKDSLEARDFRLYLKRYPQGVFAAQARERLKQAHKTMAAWALPISVGAAIVLSVFLFVATRGFPAARAEIEPAAAKAGLASLAAPRSDMEAFARAEDFLSADRVVGAALDGAALCANYRRADDSCQAITQFRRADGGALQEVERTHLMVRGHDAVIESRAAPALKDGFVCYDDPSAIELRVAHGALPNQAHALSAMRAAMVAHSARRGRICVGLSGAPEAFRMTGFDAAGARIDDPERWTSVVSLVAGAPALRAQGVE
jgi:TIR domain